MPGYPRVRWTFFGCLGLDAELHIAAALILSGYLAGWNTALGGQHSHLPLTVAVSSWHPTERRHSRGRWFASGQR
jgi:hypothetical protein